MTKHFSWINIAFYLILSDALINYFLKTFYQRLPVLAIIPLLIILHFIFNNKSLRFFTARQIVIILLGATGYLLAIITAPESVPNNRVFEIFGALSAWVVGYLWFIQSEKNSNSRWYGVLLIVGIHVIVCTIAVLNIFPAYFPTEDKIWSLNGDLITRPAVTTDQNFQIFYFLPIAALFAFYSSRKIFVYTGILLIMSAYVLAALQTRSGILVLGGVLFSAIIMQLLSDGKMKGRAIFLSIILFFVTISIFVFKTDLIRELLLRFTDENYGTAFGRLHGLLYFFEKVINPLWWIPQGNEDYMRISNGVIPHSNITAHFLDGGILGVFCWMALIVIPTLRLTSWVILKYFHIDSAIVASICLGSFVVQLSLNVPFVDQTWLWGGIACASFLLLQKRYKNRNHANSDNAIT